ncbi:SRPBCC family protein [Actinomadura sp. 9N407]|uniref:SRPBCC family protein n=1 Tax=Actinomadura sp. 9N407 TaxID=3375154 RepID=UPI0037886A1B
MELDHEFTVPVPVDQAWSVLLDVERVASCMPGATLDSVDGDEYAGRMKVKVGAMTITYRGTARITSADESARTVTLEASAKEARGSGTASATVVSQLHDEGDSTRVTVHTKLNVTGRPAQFGRNILSEVGGKLVSRFATSLAEELESPESTGPAPADPAPADAATPDGGLIEAKPVEAPADPAAGEPAAGEIAEASAAPGGTGSGGEPTPIAPQVPQQRPASAMESTSSDGVVSPIRRRREADDAIDLLEIAGPSVAKRALPAAGAVLALLLVIRFLVRRRRKG